MQGLGAAKERWYTEKLGARSPEERRAVVDSYLQGLHWVLEYYYSVGPSQLSSDELARNELGGILVFTALDDSQEKEFCKTTMAQVFSDVIHPKSKLVTRPMPPPLPVGDRGFEPLICPGTTTGLYAPHGYPSLKSLTVRPELRMAGINVLGTASRKESLLLVLRDLRAALGGRTINTGDIAKSLLNTRCYVNWPYLQEARIERVSDAKEIWYATGHAHQAKTWQSQEAAKWSADAGQVCKGFVKNLDGTINKLYSTDEVKFPVQVISVEGKGG
ncbi:5'-3' exoribonuclease 1 [Haematococcus lacustris]|uniref:5'-3' exoribonuclease 1 n=1 Tax=Haematococcus lacustris TaxID=44745 RepID=A0A699ZFQ4_HAELA|nr:5'-3' exoribonuclease 1 [Haematococcus lacustris]